jgi:hypothetical protein
MKNHTEHVLVRLEDMTDEEIETVARDLEEKGRAHFNHAEELRRYREQRAAGTQE